MRPATRAALALVITAIALLGATAPAGAANGAWAYNGSFSSQGRGSNEIKFSGDVTAPSDTCLPGETRCFFTIRLVALSLDDPGASVELSSSSTQFLPGQTKFVEGTFEVPKPGKFALAVSVQTCFIGLQFCPGGTVPVTGSPVATVVLPASQTPVTRLSADKIIQGSSVIISVVNEVHWSDGVVTDVALSENEYAIDLQERPVGSSGWKTVAQDANRFTGHPTGSVELRSLVNGSPTSAVLLTVTAPTSKQRFTMVQGPGKPVFASTPLRLTYALQSLYDDSEWRPTPRQAVTVQFSPRKNGPWQNVASGWVNKGEGLKTVVAKTTGYWRIRTAAVTSAPVFVKVNKR